LPRAFFGRRSQHTFSLAIIVFGAARFRVNEEVAIYAIALAISVIPEGLIAVLTITMSAGTSRMAKNSVIVRRLNALEALGGVTYVLLVDRTESAF
jgi:Na+-exporting ATPase